MLSSKPLNCVKEILSVLLGVVMFWCPGYVFLFLKNPYILEMHTEIFNVT